MESAHDTVVIGYRVLVLTELDLGSTGNECPRFPGTRVVPRLRRSLHQQHVDYFPVCDYL